jgi:hypothetical protein
VQHAHLKNVHYAGVNGTYVIFVGMQDVQQVIVIKTDIKNLDSLVLVDVKHARTSRQKIINGRGLAVAAGHGVNVTSQRQRVIIQVVVSILNVSYLSW